jgi:hypothetical protein
LKVKFADSTDELCSTAFFFVSITRTFTDDMDETFPDPIASRKLTPLMKNVFSGCT